jgi:Domain of unknown function (DUF427)
MPRACSSPVVGDRRTVTGAGSLEGPKPVEASPVLVFTDLVWTYPDPIPECPKIKGYLCFFNEHVDDILVDGVSQPRPLTPWSKDWNEKAATVPDPRGPVVRP